MQAADQQPETHAWRRGLEPKIGLSGKLLLLTIPLILIAEILIYVPSIANFRLNRLNDRLAAANTAALVLDASPSGMVPDTLARQVLDSIDARAVAIKMGQQRRLLASSNLPTTIDHVVDMRDVTPWAAIVDAFVVMLESGNQTIRVIGPAEGGAQFIEVVIDEAPLRIAMYRFSSNLLLVSLTITSLTTALIYLALHFLFVRPMRRLTANMVNFRRDPESPAVDRGARPARRRDRPRRARIVRHAARSGVDAASEEPARRARPRGVEDQPRSAQPAGVVAVVVRPALQRARSAGAAIRAEAGALAGARDRVLPVDAVLRPCPGGGARSPHGADRAGGQRGARDRRAGHRRRLSSITWVSAIERGLTIDADPDQLFRVLLNLVRNAAQALESQPRSDAALQQIRITGRREGSVTILEVSDTGPGVPQKARDHLFEAFHGSVRAGGSGLGLAIAAELVRAHGGDIKLVEGTLGATFRISIPDRPIDLHSLRNERARA